MGRGSRGASLVAPSAGLVGWACDSFLQHKESQAKSKEVRLLLVSEAIEFPVSGSTSKEARFPALDVETANFGLGCIAWAVPGGPYVVCLSLRPEDIFNPPLKHLDGSRKHFSGRLIKTVRSRLSDSCCKRSAKRYAKHIKGALSQLCRGLAGWRLLFLFLFSSHRLELTVCRLWSSIAETFLL
jgi:hypothetical protein